MTETNPVFQYLKKENITINKSEFLFQHRVHPDYPKLLSVVDTLNFLNIPANAFHITQEEYSLLPEYFISYLNLDKSIRPYLIKTEAKAKYTIYKGKKRISLSEHDLSDHTNGVFLLIEKEDNTIFNFSSEILKRIPLLLLTSLLIALLLIKGSNIFSNIFFLSLSILGLYLSATTLKDIFGIKNSLIDNICNISAKTNCTTLINSGKQSFFRYINFSDLSLLFFSGQILGMFVFLISDMEIQFFAVQKLLLYCAIPFISLSIFYQLFIVHKWCLICLSIILILVTELIYLSIFFKNISFQNTEIFFLCGIIIFSLITFWQWVKNSLLKQKKLQEFFIEGNRLAMDYNIFKNTLTATNKLHFPHSVFEAGNAKADKTLSISTNPFCAYCKEAHQLAKKIAKKHSGKLSIKIILNIDLISLDNDLKTEFCRRLVSAYSVNSEKFTEALDYWFEQEDIIKWNKKYGNISISDDAEEILKSHHFWALNNKFQFTPAIFIDGFPFPKKFDRKYLPYYIEEFLEDDNW